MSATVMGSRTNKGRVRIIARKGNDHILIKVDDIAYCFTKEKLVFLVDKNGHKFLTDGSLQNLEEQLDPDVFFRINRQEIVSIYFIKSFRTFERLRLEIELTLPEQRKLYSSQSATIAFRKWIDEH